MADVDEITPGLQAFIESMGLYFERYGLPRIGGRILGLLCSVDRPLSQDAMATALSVSRASISTNIRLIVETGAVEVVSLPGDRRDYYRFTANPWERGILVNIEHMVRLRRIAEQGLTALSPVDEASRARLLQMLDFCDFALDEYRAMLERWRTRVLAHAQT